MMARWWARTASAIRWVIWMSARLGSGLPLDREAILADAASTSTREPVPAAVRKNRRRMDPSTSTTSPSARGAEAIPPFAAKATLVRTIGVGVGVGVGGGVVEAILKTEPVPLAR